MHKKRMKAVSYSRYGPPEVLRVTDEPMPAPGSNEVLIRVVAAEVTKADCEMRSFRFAVQWFWLPLRLAWGLFRPRKRILGGYLAGEIVALGDGVEHRQVDASVIACAGLKMGGHGQYVVLPDHYTMVDKPKNMSYEEAAVVPLGGLNALHFMRRANVREGDSVLINGAGGSIGAHAVQIAKNMGAIVTAVDVGFKEPFVRKMGADEFIDYTKTDFTRGERSYDVIFDMVASSDYGACIASLKPGGRYLKGNPRLIDMFRSVVTTRFSDKTALFAFAPEKAAELSDLCAMIERGELISIVDRIYPMADADRAHERVETEQRSGAVVLSLAEATAASAPGS